MLYIHTPLGVPLPQENHIKWRRRGEETSRTNPRVPTTMPTMSNQENHQQSPREAESQVAIHMYWCYLKLPRQMDC